MHTFVLAGGCFWCPDAAYRTLRGVSDVMSRYTGGHTFLPKVNKIRTSFAQYALTS